MKPNQNPSSKGNKTEPNLFTITANEYFWDRLYDKIPQNDGEPRSFAKGDNTIVGDPFAKIMNDNSSSVDYLYFTKTNKIAIVFNSGKEFYLRTVSINNYRKDQMKMIIKELEDIVKLSLSDKLHENTMQI